MLSNVSSSVHMHQVITFCLTIVCHSMRCSLCLKCVKHLRLHICANLLSWAKLPETSIGICEA